MSNGRGKIEIIKPFGEAFELMKKILFQPFDFKKWFVIGFAAFLSGQISGVNLPLGNWGSTRTEQAVLSLVGALYVSFPFVWSSRQQYDDDTAPDYFSHSFFDGLGGFRVCLWRDHLLHGAADVRPALSSARCVSASRSAVFRESGSVHFVLPIRLLSTPRCGNGRRHRHLPDLLPRGAALSWDRDPTARIYLFARVRFIFHSAIRSRLRCVDGRSVVITSARCRS